jgi:hypothetical protein
MVTRRRGFWGAVAVAVVLTLSVAAIRMASVDASKSDRLIAHIAASFPTPAGTTRVNRYFSGGGCRWSFTCERRTLTVMYDGRDSVTCESAAAAVSNWQAFRAREPGGDCEIAGSVRKHPVSVETLSLDGSDHLSIRLTVAGSTDR